MKLILSFVISLGLLSSMSAKANEAVIEAMGEYLMFQEYESGIILPQQIDQSVGVRTEDHVAGNPWDDGRLHSRDDRCFIYAVQYV